MQECLIEKVVGDNIENKGHKMTKAKDFVEEASFLDNERWVDTHSARLNQAGERGQGEGEDDGVTRMVALDAPVGVRDICSFDKGGQLEIVEFEEVCILCMTVSKKIWNRMFLTLLTRILSQLPCLT